MLGMTGAGAPLPPELGAAAGMTPPFAPESVSPAPPADAGMAPVMPSPAGDPISASMDPAAMQAAIEAALAQIRGEGHAALDMEQDAAEQVARSAMQALMQGPSPQDLMMASPQGVGPAPMMPPPDAGSQDSLGDMGMLLG